MSEFSSGLDPYGGPPVTPLLFASVDVAGTMQWVNKHRRMIVGSVSKPPLSVVNYASEAHEVPNDGIPQLSAPNYTTLTRLADEIEIKILGNGPSINRQSYGGFVVKVKMGILPSVLVPSSFPSLSLVLARSLGAWDFVVTSATFGNARPEAHVQSSYGYHWSMVVGDLMTTDQRQTQAAVMHEFEARTGWVGGRHASQEFHSG
ncbi:hypothetical protein B0H14DRAFT_2658425, partial [Mycena olivaceomarginata]